MTKRQWSTPLVAAELLLIALDNSILYTALPMLTEGTGPCPAELAVLTPGAIAAGPVQS